MEIDATGGIATGGDRCNRWNCIMWRWMQQVEIDATLGDSSNMWSCKRWRKVQIDELQQVDKDGIEPGGNR